MTFSASSSLASGATVTGSALITALIGVDFASFPAATARITMSRSVMMPTSLPFATTGSDPQSSCFMSVAACATVSSGLTTVGLDVIRSLTFMFIGGAPPAVRRQQELGRADLEDLCPADGARALRRRAAVLHRDLLRVLDLARGLALDAVAVRHDSPPRSSRTRASYPRPLHPLEPQNPAFRRGLVVRKGRVGIS